jgi:acyl-CoA thioester hydrolase
VVHFSNYFRWMEEAEHAFFRSLGLSVHQEDAGGEGGHLSWPRVSTACEYLAPARFEDEITLKLRVERVGEKSLSYEVDFSIGEKVIARAKLTSVCCRVTPTSFTPVAIPPAVREKLTRGDARGD